MTQASSSKYDVIVIGSGMGGMTVASLMARMRGKRVLILERHFKAGGYTHTFTRGNYEWDVGVHYVGRVTPNTPVRSMFDFITDSGVAWTPLPDPYDRFVYPGLTFDVRKGREQYERDLIAQFPHEATAIKAYFDDILKAADVHLATLLRGAGSKLLNARGALKELTAPRRFRQNTRDYLAWRFRDPQLRGVVTSIWGNYGLPPHQCPFQLHARIKSAYLDGAHYPDAGASRIAQTIEKIVRNAGGQVLRGRAVKRLKIERGRAVGVFVEHVGAKGNVIETEEYDAPVIVSNAGAANTYLNLLPSDYPLPFRGELQRFVETQPHTSAIVLYLGFSKDPRVLGFKGENYWMYDGFDHDETYRKCDSWIEAGGRPPMAYLSMPTLKQSGITRHTAQIISGATQRQFARWRGQRWLERDTAYREQKARISEELLDLVERHHPGFRAIVDYQELSTPLTNESMTGHRGGTIYGLPHVQARLDHRAWTNPRSPVPGLYLTGADVFVMGVIGATMSGLLTLGNLPDGVPIKEAFKTALKHAEQQPSPLEAAPAQLEHPHGGPAAAS